MKISSPVKYSFFLLLAALISCMPSFAQKTEGRTIELAGLIVDAESLAPIEEAEVFDATNNKIGVSDDKGYYKVTVNCTSTGDLDFKFNVRKRGYQTFNQHEHWANTSHANGIMYFGLKAGGSKAKEFSLLSDQKNELDYAAVLKGFDKVKEQQQFNAGLDAAKEGNAYVFIKVNDKPYLVNNTGWILLQSDSDLVSIDNKQIVPANKLNELLKRKQIRGMTPVDAADKKFIVYTR